MWPTSMKTKEEMMTVFLFFNLSPHLFVLKDGKIRNQIFQKRVGVRENILTDRLLDSTSHD